MFLIYFFLNSLFYLVSFYLLLFYCILVYDYFDFLNHSKSPQMSRATMQKYLKLVFFKTIIESSKS